MRLVRLGLALAVSLAAAPAWAQTGAAPTTIDWIGLALGAVAGLALFLFGVSLLADALRELGGGKFQRLLERCASNRFTGLASGTVATVALDSSSVTIILLVTMVDAGLVAFAAALPVILGANIGTTISSQIFAWSLDEYSPLLLFAGMLWRLVAKTERARQIATVVLGLGLVLFGLFTIGEAAEPMKDYPPAIRWLAQLENPLLGVIAGAVMTVVLQSSSAMMGIAITLAAGGLISLPAGVAIMLGAEIGTCADTLIATIGRSRAAVRAGLFHLLFNIASVAVGILLLGQLTAFGAATADNVGLQLANAHVLFNLAGALIALPFVGAAAWLLERVVPDRAAPVEAMVAEPVRVRA